ncbi:MAG TPA: hypothetical protein VN345_11100 [Blastocatellia bacterium]|jgi:hypothetical protein|nr:hypothetical protein [Blastocatellia bacterium]
MIPRKTRTKLIGLGLAISCALSASMIAPARADNKAQEVIKQVRAAIGGDSKLDSIASLEMSGKLTRSLGGKSVTSDLTLSVLLPDKFKRVEVASGGAVEYTRTVAMDGDEGWVDLSSPNGFGPKGAYMKSAAGKGNETDAQKAQVDAVRVDFARLLIGLLLAAPSAYPVEFKHAGEAQMDKTQVDLLDATGPGQFAVRLFIDKQVHHPVLMTYDAPARTGAAAGGNQGDKAAAKPELQKVQVLLADYRPEDGILLPHQITRAAAGQTFEDLLIAKYKINPSLKPQSFKKK